MHLLNLTAIPLVQYIASQSLLTDNYTSIDMPSQLSSFHEGEAAMRNMLHVPAGRNPTAPGLPMPYAMRVRQSPLVALGTLDSQGRPWTTIWGGERGFAGPVAQGVLGFNSAVDMRYDPVFEALWTNQGDDGIVRPNDGQGKMMAGLAIDLETRDRVKLAGVMVAGAVVKDGDEGVGDVQAAMVVTESLGNCPKYLNKKDVVRHDPGSALLVSDELPLPREALDLVYKADMIFVSSTNGETMDTNHRGGSPGFVRVVKNEGGQVELVYPECKFLPICFLLEICLILKAFADGCSLWKQIIPNTRQPQSKPPNRHSHPRLRYSKRALPHRSSRNPSRKGSVVPPRKNPTSRQDHRLSSPLRQGRSTLPRRARRILAIQPTPSTLDFREERSPGSQLSAGRHHCHPRRPPGPITLHQHLHIQTCFDQRTTTAEVGSRTTCFSRL